MTKPTKKPRDVNSLAAAIVNDATTESRTIEIVLDQHRDRVRPEIIDPATQPDLPALLDTTS